MSGVQQAVFQNQRSFAGPPGQQEYTTPGTYSWVAPAGITSISVVAVGAGWYTGGGLGYRNNITVVPGNSYSLRVGNTTSGQGQSSYVSGLSVEGKAYPDRGYVGDGGGYGGAIGSWGGAGAAGYSGNGGAGNATVGSTASYQNGSGSPGSGGGGGGGGAQNPGNGAVVSGGGGGVGLLGQGNSGGSGYATSGGTGGSGGGNGTTASGTNAGNGGDYGGGKGFGGTSYASGGAVRIIWPGDSRQFPSTDTGNV